MNGKLGFLAMLLCVMFMPRAAAAVLPPDILFNIGSQAVTFFSLIALFLSSLVATASNTWQSFYGPIQNKKTFWISVAVLVAVVSSLGALFAENARKARLYDTWLAGVSSVATSTSLSATTTSSGKAFHSNRFIVYGIDETETPFLFEVDANRRQVASGVFFHYYFGNILSRGESYSAYHMMRSTSSTLLSTDFMYNIAHARHADLSSRETYAFTVQAPDTTYAVQMNDLEADFLVKNVPESTRYYSIGSATVSSGSSTFTAHAALSTIYSTDFSRYIFFNGYDELEADAFQFTLWDEEGTFFLFDQTTVLSTFNHAYTSHTWGLYKSVDGYSRRAFDVEIERGEDQPYAWRIEAPSLQDAVVTLSLGNQIDRKHEKGFVQGTITDAAGTRSIAGLGHYRMIRSK